MLLQGTVSALLFSSLSTMVLGHSMLEKIWGNGVEYKGWDANAGAAGTLYPSNTPSWFTTNVGGGPLIPASFNSYDMICAKGSNPSNISAPANAGSVVTVKLWMVDQPFPEG